MLDDQKELFIVVDKDDTILAYRTRYECHHDKALIHRTIGIILYNHKGEILLQKRSMLKDLHPGKYSISVTGHVTKGQTGEEAAKRELEEELGVQTALTFIKKFIVSSDQESEMANLFKGHHSGPFYPAKDEVDNLL